MPWRRLSIGLLVVLAACSSTVESLVTTTGSTPTSTRGPGRLAVLDEMGSVVVMDRDGANRVVLAEGGASGVFAQPIWSADGSAVSWSMAADTGAFYVIHDLGGGFGAEVAVGEFPFYASWSPSGETIGLLRNGPSGVVLELLDVAEAASSAVASETPYYFSWDPAGSGFVAHAGETGLVTSDSTGMEVKRDPTAPGYLAPFWLESGVLHMGDGLMLLNGGSGDLSEIAQVGPLATFVANGPGDKVAIQAISADPAISVALEDVPEVRANRVSVVDLDSGEVAVVSEGRVSAFFWSPDGAALLMLTPNQARDSLLVSVWDGSETVDYGSYVPSPSQLRDVFPFFPQYAQSMSYWSADSSSFALVGAVDGEPGVWVQHVDGSEPTRVSGGSWAAWSP